MNTRNSVILRNTVRSKIRMSHYSPASYVSFEKGGESVTRGSAQADPPCCCDSPPLANQPDFSFSKIVVCVVLSILPPRGNELYPFS